MAAGKADEKPGETIWRSTKKVARVMDVDESTVRRWCRAGQVTCELTPSDGAWRVLCRARDGFPIRESGTP